MHPLLDDVNWRLLQALQANGRASYKELGALVGLSPPAVAERVRRMEEAGIITAYRAEVDLAKIGRPLVAAIRSSPPDKAACGQVEAYCRERPEVLRCWRVTGTDSYHIIVAVPSPSELHVFIDGLMEFGPLTTSLVLDQAVDHKVLGPPVVVDREGPDDPMVA